MRGNGMQKPFRRNATHVGIAYYISTRKLEENQLKQKAETDNNNNN